MSKIDILTYFDNHHEYLYKIFFLPSYQKYLSQDFNLIVHTRQSGYSDTSFESKNWCQIIIDRFDMLLTYVQNHKHSWAIFSDTDILFLDNFRSNIDSYINTTQDKKIYYMAENCKYHTYKKHHMFEINGGFFLFYCCDEIFQFFNYIKNNISLMEKPNDQIFIQKLISTQNQHIDIDNIKIDIDLLDSKLFVTNNNPVNQLFNRMKFMKVFHATSTKTIMEKINLLSSISIRNAK